MAPKGIVRAEWHRGRVSALVEAGVDLLAVETIPALKEGLAIVKWVL